MPAIPPVSIGTAVFGGPLAGVDFARVDGRNAAHSGQTQRATVAVALCAGLDHRYRIPVMPMRGKFLRVVLRRQQLGIRQQRAAPQAGVIGHYVCHGLTAQRVAQA